MEEYNFNIYDERVIYLLEVASYFNSENRSLSENKMQCIYGGNGCAIGMKIQDKELCDRLDNGGGSSVSNINTFIQIPSELRIYGHDFLSQIQSLHDIRSNWDKNGIKHEDQFWNIFDNHCIQKL